MACLGLLAVCRCPVYLAIHITYHLVTCIYLREWAYRPEGRDEDEVGRRLYPLLFFGIGVGEGVFALMFTW